MVRRSSKSKSSVSRPAGTLRIIMPSSSRAPPAPTNSTASNEAVTEEDVNKLSIADLTLDTPLIPLRPKRRVPRTPFHFLSLPAEVRIQIYTYFYDDDVDETIDLCPQNYKRYHKKLSLVRVCRQVRDEATFAFYSTRTFRLFPTYPGRYFKTKKPLLARLKPNQRRCITSLELFFGPGWNAPPKGWVVNPALGLSDCVGVQRLKVFVEFDPSDKYFNGWRRSDGFYEGFSKNLLSDVLENLPSVEVVEFDGWTSVSKSGAMMQALMETVTQSGCTIEWGPKRGWTDAMDDDNDIADEAVAYPEGFPHPGYEANSLLASA
ncbi:3 exoribonuclease family [Fusarium albosuccineum]|uniref:3 exoribonuclease family n=1 Tax=Fusarium albosuccineum TaxID=1237068 RepID=A0A8H4PA75_9HYPO|nr:3 exoribonuclease family [Fusarium albosuccineum]